MAKAAKIDGLTPLQKAFCETYVANNYQNATWCYEQVNPNVKHDSARVTAWKLLQKPEVKEYIREYQRERTEALNITAERIAEELAKMAFGEVGEDTGLKYSDKKGALDLLQKQLGLQKQNIKADVDQSVNIKIGVEE